jgi:hypothetical protein
MGHILASDAVGGTHLHPGRTGLRASAYLGAAVMGIAVLAGGAALANTCQTEHLLCPTTMPIDGYCECKAHGITEDGTVVAKPPPHRPTNATAGGCGAQPGSPGCR